MNRKRVSIIALIAGIGFLFLFPNFVNAISNEQVISERGPDPGNPSYSRHASIDSDGDDVVAAFVTERGIIGGKVFNVQLARSTDGGVNWAGHTWVQQNPIDQWYPDIQILDIPDFGKIVFVVWQETDNPLNSPSAIYTKAVYFNDFSEEWEEMEYGAEIVTAQNLNNYPRIAGTITDCASSDGGQTSYDLLKMHYVWESYVGSGASAHWEIQMKSFYWHNDNEMDPQWSDGGRLLMDDYVDLRHPSIDAGVPIGDNELGEGNNEHVVLTYDCYWRDQSNADTRFTYLTFDGKTEDSTQISPGSGKGDIVFSQQDTYYFPDITLWGFEETTYPCDWRWETVIVGQKLGSPDNYIAGKGNINFASTWSLEFNVGSMLSTYPQLRGVAIDSGHGDAEQGNFFPGGISVIWDTDAGNSQIRSRKLGISALGDIIAIGSGVQVDTYGLSEGELRYVAISYTHEMEIINNEEYYNGCTHNLYNCIVGSTVEPIWSGDVVYYTNP